MADAVISFAVEKVCNLFIEKVTFLKGVKEQVEGLKDELLYMQSFLKDAAEKQGNDERIRKWISDIREVAFDAEDAIETFILKVDTPRRRRGPMRRCLYFPVHVARLHTAGKQIKSIRGRLDDIRTRCQTYGIQSLGGGTSMVLSRRRSEAVEQRRRLSPREKDKHLVGLKEDVNSLLANAILDETKKGLSVAAIVGMGGIGKSTLARKIYSHPAVAARFNCRAWVVVSSEFTAADIFKQIMLQLHIPLPNETLNLVNSIENKLSRQEMLKDMLREHLQGVQYFIVLDDVWERTHWESLWSAFPDEQGKTSRLLFTSRKKIITEHEGYIHKMNVLNSDESWELFLKTALNGKTDCPKGLETTGREIWKKCGYLPLAIIVAGGLLLEKGESEKGWEEVLKLIEKTHSETSEDIVSAVLELSYHDLPPQLKACFLCLGFFKEDASIQARSLVQIWVAQGFIPSNEVGGGETMEEIAMSYLDELINRNLVQVKYMSIEGQNKHLRSLLLHVGVGAHLWVSSPSYWKGHELIRILDLDGFHFVTLPEGFRELIGLRCLRLTIVRELPSWLDRLKKLEVLHIFEDSVKLPDATLKMDSLRHFYAYHVHGPMEIDNWKKLETLDSIEVKNWSVFVPTASCHIRKLGIEMDARSDTGSISKSFEKMKKLVQLKVKMSGNFGFEFWQLISRLDHLTKLKLRGRITEFPTIRMFPQNLSYLTLERSETDEDPMPALGKLPKLLYLKLNDAYNGERMGVLHDGFPKLKVLSLGWMKDLSFINVQGGGMPELQRLEIHYCSQLKTQNLPEPLKSAALK